MGTKAYKVKYGSTYETAIDTIVYLPSVDSSVRPSSNDTVRLYSVDTVTDEWSWYEYIWTFLEPTQEKTDIEISYGFINTRFEYESDTWFWFTESKKMGLGSNRTFQVWNGTTQIVQFSPSWYCLPSVPTDTDLNWFVVSAVEDSPYGDFKFASTYRVFSNINEYKAFWSGIEPYVEDTDPYAEGGNSGTGGGTGTFSGTGDSIDFPGLPTLSAVSTGFITLFNPSIAQMASLANYMWSDLFDIDTFKKIFADPMDCILGLSIVPVAVPNGGTAEVKVGNISTGVSMTVASTQYVEVDCGTLNVKEYWGSYLDYDPYTKAEIYLPYCGTHPIAVDDIMGKSVHVKYHVDILSGACVAYVKCGSSVLYSFIGQCTSSIPITGNDWTNVVNGAISIASAIGSMVATGGATAPLVMPGVASTAVNSLKPSVEKSGSMSGTGGMLAVQTPYLILTRPRQALPKNQNTYTGYPSFIKEKLSDLKGYTEVAEIRLSGVDATDAELDEIVSLLKGGVII